MLKWPALLKTIGFTDSEAKIYILSLELGPSSVQDIAKKAGVSRVTTYTAIESLTQKGLMSSVEKGKKTLYAAESPDRLVSFVRSRLQHMQITLKEIEALLDDLKLLQRGEKPIVKLFEGPEGLKAVNADILETRPDVIYEMSNIDARRQLFSRETFLPFQQELDRRQTKTHLIGTYSKPIHSRVHVAIRQISEQDYKFFGNILIYKNKVSFSSLLGKNISVVVESEAIAHTLTLLFQLAWEGAEKHLVTKEAGTP